MANHASARHPWAVDDKIFSLFAKHAMEAAFGGCYVSETNRGDLSYGGDLNFVQIQKSQGAWTPATQIWRDSDRHVEMRHGCSGLDRVAQALEFEALCSCFGAPVANDDGIGDYLVDKPGRFQLLPMRGHCDGLGPKAKSKGMAKVGKMLAKMMGSPDQWANAQMSADTMWLLSSAQQETAKKMLDPIFFEGPQFDTAQYFIPGPTRDAYLKHKKIDVLAWGSKLDWAAVVESAYPAGAGLDAKSAASALLPSAALGQDCPPSALAKASVPALERALGVALLWSNPDVAKQIHSALATKSPDMEASDKQAFEICSKFLAKRERTKEGDPIEHQRASSLALAEALSMSTVAAKPSKAPKSKPAL
jgi:hypothetical protein